MITSSGNFQIIKFDVIFEFQFLNHLKLSLCIFSIIFCIEALQLLLLILKRHLLSDTSMRLEEKK